jgi:hypothetical protein
MNTTIQQLSDQLASAAAHLGWDASLAAWLLVPVGTDLNPLDTLAVTGAFAGSHQKQPVATIKLEPLSQISSNHKRQA